MAWVKHGNRKYFYRSVWSDGQRKYLYLGSGPAAEQAAEEIERRKNERTACAEELARVNEINTAAIDPLEKLCRFSDLLMRSTLIREGYHQHARGQWRKKRHDPENQGSQGSQ
jgi:hypothetical protein